MVHAWMLDVLTDLREFAGKNGLGVTQQQLDSILVKVADELASAHGIAQGTAHIGHVGELSGSFGAGRNTG